MDSIDSDVPQAKASRRQQKEHALEHCQGYVDKNGMWNNGFYCPRWGGPEDNYCCGDGTERFCCPEPATELVTTSSQFDSTDAASFNFLPIVIGISAGLLVFILGLVVGYFICPCCPGRRRSSRKRTLGTAGQAASAVRRTLSVSLEAEATSAVIAAQALVPLQGGGGGGGMCQASPVPSSSTGATDDVHLHCGCRWSPSTSRSTVVDVDSGPCGQHQSAFHSPSNMTWQTELDNMYNCSCEKALMNESKSLRTPAEHLYHMLAASGRHIQPSHNHPSSGSSSPLCLESFRATAVVANTCGSKCGSDDGSSTGGRRHHHHHHYHQHPQQQQQQQQQRLLVHNPHVLRGLTSCSPADLQVTTPRSPRTYGALQSSLDADGQRRDSGVLIEDTELQGDGVLTDTYAATSIMPMPSLVVERIGRVVASR